ncbi:uncharacterized protein LOC127149820 [Cucumis melo]|uniref:Uncharacterized protein LOC127149038 n=1 Tax=Cucumis melo TaxID=3656 RepID=A0ABM3KPK7_CUCME|nr:uncharacterized protein LOC127149038 [Cucumis melo]XP_050939704.1 uncharacterized protein LOC127149039 [Cucumis melo]XP_050941753.1 uncharacterized protein LOC127149819 [Cucumis melo]XP_050941754.1 uncharacterized protein LOC127149820 [Cucumis melo]
MALLFSLEGSTELTLKFSGSATDLVGDSFLSLGGSVERSFQSRGITEFQVGVQRGADRREAGRMREGHMDASDFLSLPLCILSEYFDCDFWTGDLTFYFVTF